MQKIGNALGFIWAFPATFLGWIFCLVMLCARQIGLPHIGSNFTIWWPVYIDSWFHRALENRAAFVFGANIIWVYMDETIARHEDQHIKDIYVFGIFFYLIYLIEFLFIWCFMDSKDPYFDLWFERRARDAEKETN